MPQPVATFRQPLTLRYELPCPATFILCSQAGVFAEFADRVRPLPGWSCRELPAGHMPMFTMPTELADLLLEAAANEGISHG